MKTRTVFHASLAAGITRFYDNSHFGFEEEQCVNVLVRKLFADTLDPDYASARPTLYRCEATLAWESELTEFGDLMSPFPEHLFVKWRDRKQNNQQALDKVQTLAHDDQRHYFWRELRAWKPVNAEFHQLTDSDLKVAWLKAKFRSEGYIGYRYDNVVEGGRSICLLDASVVRVVGSSPVSSCRLAASFLSTPREDLSSRIDDESYKIARQRAANVLGVGE